MILFQAAEARQRWASSRATSETGISWKKPCVAHRPSSTSLPSSTLPSPWSTARCTESTSKVRRSKPSESRFYKLAIISTKWEGVDPKQIFDSNRYTNLKFKLRQPWLNSNSSFKRLISWLIRCNIKMCHPGCHWHLIDENAKQSNVVTLPPPCFDFW